MHKMKKPDGTILEVNENSLKWAEALGWELVKETKKPAATKGRKRGNSTDDN